LNKIGNSIEAIIIIIINNNNNNNIKNKLVSHCIRKNISFHFINRQRDFFFASFIDVDKFVFLSIEHFPLSNSPFCLSRSA